MLHAACSNPIDATSEEDEGLLTRHSEYFMHALCGAGWRQCSTSAELGGRATQTAGLCTAAAARSRQQHTGSAWHLARATWPPTPAAAMSQHQPAYQIAPSTLHGCGLPQTLAAGSILLSVMQQPVMSRCACMYYIAARSASTSAYTCITTPTQTVVMHHTLAVGAACLFQHMADTGTTADRQQCAHACTFLSAKSH